MGTNLKDDPDHPGKHINPETGIWPISEWGAECGRGFVGSERFATRGEKVIKRGTHKLYRQYLDQRKEHQKL